MEANDFVSFSKQWTKSPNPSNQNFHNKMIRSIGINNKIDVVSIRPFNKKLCKTRKLKAESPKIEGNITWHYLEIKGGKFRKLSLIKKQTKSLLKSLIKDGEERVIFTDTINPACISTANFVSKIYQIPTIGICTDSPQNITGVKNSYISYILRQSSKCYGYIALTNDLNTLFNQNNKPSLIIEGVCDDREVKSGAIGIETPYFFFGGALLPRYGVYNLIAAFNMLKTAKVDLYICGHSGNDEEIKNAISGNPNIHFLGALPVSVVLDYEHAALANINPRPFDEELDRLSIPSKTIEYLSSGRPTISVVNSKLKVNFDDCVVWSNSGTPEDLCQSLRYVIGLTKEERKNLGQSAKAKAIKLYSLKSVNKKINIFLELFKTRVN